MARSAWDCAAPENQKRPSRKVRCDCISQVQETAVQQGSVPIRKFPNWGSVPNRSIFDQYSQESVSGSVPNLSPHRGLSAIVVAGVIGRQILNHQGSVPIRSVCRASVTNPNMMSVPNRDRFWGQVRSRTFWCGKLPSDRNIGPVPNFTRTTQFHQKGSLLGTGQISDFLVWKASVGPHDLSTNSPMGVVKTTAANRARRRLRVYQTNDGLRALQSTWPEESAD